MAAKTTDVFEKPFSDCILCVMSPLINKVNITADMDDPIAATICLDEFMIADAKKRNLGKIELDVWEFNDSAIEFYQAVGFRQTRRWMEYEVE